MSLGYQAVGWNKQKKGYDSLLLGGVALFLALSILLGAVQNPNATAETLLIRAFGSAALVLLHVVLIIGPLCRLDARFLPLLYNRRHMGVTMFVLALVHGAFSIVQFHGAGDRHPLVSLLTAGSSHGTFAWFPFQPLGFAALIILFLMAATSHDFWLANLGARTWKTLHMLVYVAWALVLSHVALGPLQAEPHIVPALLLGSGALVVLLLHLIAGWREAGGDHELVAAKQDGFVHVASLEEIPLNRAKVVTLEGERVAVFRHGRNVSAISNVCRHQNGPLGEGRIIDGCITCPWHGYQYRPEDGCSPPPFTERVPTYRVRVVGDQVLVDPHGNAPGTYVEPAQVGPAVEALADEGRGGEA